MKFSARRRDRRAVIVVAVFVIAALLVVGALWPNAFTFVVAIAGAIGALIVIYEVRLTKRIAQAEFIRDLQSGFTSDESICDIWSKLLLQREILPEDRPKISSYLTFFETLGLLLERDALELSLVDDLFRNRFFTAVGNKDILSIALLRDVGAFTNIHRLIATWHNYLLNQGLPIHAGYYSYVRELTEAKHYQVRDLSIDDLPALMDLQIQVLTSLDDPSQLRQNTREMLSACVVDHRVLGAWRDSHLVAVAVLYSGAPTGANIREHLPARGIDPGDSIDLKLVLVAPGHRRAGLARSLIELLEARAVEQGKVEIVCTIHPKNTASKALFQRLGYRRIATSVAMEYGNRDVYSRGLPDTTKRWVR